MFSSRETILSSFLMLFPDICPANPAFKRYPSGQGFLGSTQKMSWFDARQFCSDNEAVMNWLYPGDSVQVKTDMVQALVAGCKQRMMGSETGGFVCLVLVRMQRVLIRHGHRGEG